MSDDDYDSDEDIEEDEEGYEDPYKVKYELGKKEYDNYNMGSNLCKITNLPNIFGKNGNNGVSKHSYNNIEKSMLTDREKLCLKIEGFSRYIIDTYPIYNPDVDTILKYLDDVKKPIHSINPQALVLTNLIITRYGIDIDILNSINDNVIPKLTDNRITKADLIRYYRMITLHS
jgi:hypothetical protein